MNADHSSQTTRAPQHGPPRRPVGTFSVLVLLDQLSSKKGRSFILSRLISSLVHSRQLERNKDFLCMLNDHRVTVRVADRPNSGHSHLPLQVLA